MNKIKIIVDEDERIIMYKINKLNDLFKNTDFHAEIVKSNYENINGDKCIFYQIMISKK